MNLKISPIFSDNMILQRGVDLEIPGECLPFERVEIAFCGKVFSARADKDGRFSCAVGKYAANSAPLEMKISAADEEIIIRDVLIGDVWICSGQSNMELMLNRVRHNYPDEMTVTNPLIRQCKVPQVYNFSEPQNLPNTDLSPVNWECFTPETAPNFTAAGYFFAKKLHERYNVPIGLFACAVGGTPVAAWMSADMLKDFPEELAVAEKCKDEKHIETTLQSYEVYSQNYHEKIDKADTGLLENWKSADYSDSHDSKWEEVSILKPIESAGVYWYRKTLQIPPEMRGKNATIFLGTAVDADEVFVSGEKIGQTDYRYPPREYSFTLPKSAEITVAIRLLCAGNQGGFTAGKNYFIATESKTLDIGAGLWKRRLGAPCEEKQPPTFFQYCPTGLFNGMVAPLLCYAIKGVIWYQGESDTAKSGRYAEKLTALIEGWRELFALSETQNFPFLLTQLAHYHDTLGVDWELLRAEQKKVLALPNTGLAAAYDLGEYNDLHPQNKRDIGERLARLAMRIAYSENLPVGLFELY